MCIRDSFQTSTFAFRSAEEGKEYFSYAYGLSERDPARPMGLIYSRLNNPDTEILEGRLNLWDRAEASAVFASGMAAISTTLLALVPLGHSIVFARPVYGGTDDLLEIIQFNEQQIEEAGVPIHSYIAPGTNHTILGRPEVYTLDVEGVALIDWLTDYVAGDDVADVVCVDCEKPAPDAESGTQDGEAEDEETT